MYKYLLICFLIFSSFFLFLEGCKNQTTNPGGQNVQTNTGVARSFTSSSVDYLEYDGFDVVIRQNTIPRDSLGNQGTVIISVNTSSTIDQGVPVLSGFTTVSKYVHIGPDGITFNQPVKIGLPGGNVSSAANLYVLEFFPSTNDWRIVPGSSLDSVRKQVVVDVLQLGYFVLAQKSSDDWQAPYGGAQYCQIAGNINYTLTIDTVILANPSDINYYPNNLVGLTFNSMSWPGSDNAAGFCKGLLPFGNYTFWLSYRFSYSDQIYTYSTAVPLVINSSLTYPSGAWNIDDITGWTVFCNLPAGGSWIPGRPTVWSPPTIPFGTGVFEATLTWLNTSNNNADLDLHLYGPNNLHIWSGNKTSNNFALDRDWQPVTGNAVENIYSLTGTIPSGSYSVQVVHNTGNSVYFNARTILNEVSTNYTGTIGSGSVVVNTFNKP